MTSDGQGLNEAASGIITHGKLGANPPGKQALETRSRAG